MSLLKKKIPHNCFKRINTHTQHKSLEKKKVCGQFLRDRRKRSAIITFEGVNKYALKY